MAARFIRREDGPALTKEHSAALLTECLSRIEADKLKLFTMQFTVDDNEDVKGLLVMNFGKEWEGFEALHKLNQENGSETRMVDLEDEAEVWAEDDLTTTGDLADYVQPGYEDVKMQTGEEVARVRRERARSLRASREARLEEMRLEEERAAALEAEGAENLAELKEAKKKRPPPKKDETPEERAERKRQHLEKKKQRANETEEEKQARVEKKKEEHKKKKEEKAAQKAAEGGAEGEEPKKLKKSPKKKNIAPVEVPGIDLAAERAALKAKKKKKQEEAPEKKKKAAKEPKEGGDEATADGEAPAEEKPKKKKVVKKVAAPAPADGEGGEAGAPAAEGGDAGEAGVEGEEAPEDGEVEYVEVTDEGSEADDEDADYEDDGDDEEYEDDEDDDAVSTFSSAYTDSYFSDEFSDDLEEEALPVKKKVHITPEKDIVWQYERHTGELVIPVGDITSDVEDMSEGEDDIFGILRKMKHKTKRVMQRQNCVGTDLAPARMLARSVHFADVEKEIFEDFVYTPVETPLEQEVEFSPDEEDENLYHSPTEVDVDDY